MSNKTILQSNNDALSANNLELQNLIDLANALPEVSTASNIETCTIQIFENGYDYFGGDFLIAYSKLVEGMPVTVVLSDPELLKSLKLQDDYNIIALSDVVKNSLLIIRDSSGTYWLKSISSADEIQTLASKNPSDPTSFGELSLHVFQCNNNGTITLYCPSEMLGWDDEEFVEDW